MRSLALLIPTLNSILINPSRKTNQSFPMLAFKRLNKLLFFPCHALCTSTSYCLFLISSLFLSYNKWCCGHRARDYFIYENIIMGSLLWKELVKIRGDSEIKFRKCLKSGPCLLFFAFVITETGFSDWIYLNEPRRHVLRCPK